MNTTKCAYETLGVVADARDEARWMALAIGEQSAAGDAPLEELDERHDAVLGERLELLVRVETRRTQERSTIHTERAGWRRHFATIESKKKTVRKKCERIARLNCERAV